MGFGADKEQVSVRTEFESLHGFILRSLAFGAIALLTFPSARAASCESLPLPSIEVRRQDAPVTLDTSHDYRSIAVLAAQERRSNVRVLGLTRGVSRIGVELRVQSVIDPTRQWECVSPQIVVTYGFNPMTVYVAKEFPKGSCAYNEIYRHELRHVQTYLDHLSSIEKGIAETLVKRFATGRLYRGAVGQTRQMLERELNDRWLPYLNRQIERVASSQALIDTPQEYERVARSCDGAIRRVIR